MALSMASLCIGRRCLNRRMIYVEVPGLSLRLSLRLREREGMERCMLKASSVNVALASNIA